MQKTPVSNDFRVNPLQASRTPYKPIVSKGGARFEKYPAIKNVSCPPAYGIPGAGDDTTDPDGILAPRVALVHPILSMWDETSKKYVKMPLKGVDVKLKDCSYQLSIVYTNETDSTQTGRCDVAHLTQGASASALLCSNTKIVLRDGTDCPSSEKVKPKEEIKRLFELAKKSVHHTATSTSVTEEGVNVPIAKLPSGATLTLTLKFAFIALPPFIPRMEGKGSYMDMAVIPSPTLACRISIALSTDHEVVLPDTEIVTCAQRPISSAATVAIWMHPDAALDADGAFFVDFAEGAPAHACPWMRVVKAGGDEDFDDLADDLSACNLSDTIDCKLLHSMVIRKPDLHMELLSFSATMPSKAVIDGAAKKRIMNLSFFLDLSYSMGSGAGSPREKNVLLLVKVLHLIAKAYKVLKTQEAMKEMVIRVDWFNHTFGTVGATTLRGADDAEDFVEELIKKVKAISDDIGGGTTYCDTWLPALGDVLRTTERGEHAGKHEHLAVLCTDGGCRDADKTTSMAEELRKLYGGKLSIVGWGTGMWLNQPLVSNVCSDGVVFVPEITDDNVVALSKQIVGMILDRLRRFVLYVEAAKVLGVQSTTDGQRVTLLSDDDTQEDLMDLSDGKPPPPVKVLVRPGQTLRICAHKERHANVRVSVDGESWVDVANGFEAVEDEFEHVKKVEEEETAEKSAEESAEEAAARAAAAFSEKKRNGLGFLSMLDGLYRSLPTASVLTEDERNRYITAISIFAQLPSSTCDAITILQMPKGLELEAVLCPKFDPATELPLTYPRDMKMLFGCSMAGAAFVLDDDDEDEEEEGFGSGGLRSLGDERPKYRSLGAPSSAAPTNSATTGATLNSASGKTAEAWMAKFAQWNMWTARFLDLKQICYYIVDQYTPKKLESSTAPAPNDTKAEVDGVFDAMDAVAGSDQKKRASSADASASSCKSSRSSETSTPSRDTQKEDEDGKAKEKELKQTLRFLREVLFVNGADFEPFKCDSDQDTVLATAKSILFGLA